MLSEKRIKALQLRRTHTLKDIGKLLINGNTNKQGVGGQAVRFIIDSALRRLSHKYFYSVQSNPLDFEASIGFFKFLIDNDIDYVYDIENDCIISSDEIKQKRIKHIR